VKEIYLNQAAELGHKMVPVSPDRWECADCSASVFSDETGCNNWQATKTLVQCPKHSKPSDSAQIPMQNVEAETFRLNESENII